MSLGIYGLWMLVLLWISLLFCIYFIRHKKYRMLVLYFTFSAISYYLLQIICLHDSEKMPAGVIFIVCTLESLIFFFCFFREYHWMQTHLSEMTVKRAVDALPTGICCYDLDGKVLLKNKRMEKICRKMTGKPLLNGMELENFLFLQEHGPEFLRTGDHIVVIFQDQTVFEFQKEVLSDQTRTSMNREEHTKDKHLEYVIIASEITEEYQKTQILLEKQQTVTELNQRLRVYNKEILSVISAKEVLNAKVKIHDELGASLLRVRKYLADQEKADTPENLYKREWEKQEIIDLLKANVTFLQHEMKEEEQDEYYLLLKTARQLDVHVEIEGMLPVDEKIRNICVTALHECLTNTLRHAQGNFLKVSFSEDEEMVDAVYTNNGIVPSGEIVEKGGLKTLRNLVEQEGGRMDIHIDGAFVLSIHLRKRGSAYGL